MSPDLQGHNALQIYNGLDNCVTFEVHEALLSVLNDPNVRPEFKDAHERSRIVYNFVRAMQAPALAMMLKGSLIDQYERRQNTERLHTELTRLESILNLYGQACFDQDMKAGSYPKLNKLFYEVMRLPIQYKRRANGEKTPSTDRTSLEKLSAYFHARPIIECIFAIRETKKLLSLLETSIDPDGRIRTSYNVAGTDTERWSSSSSAFGTGTNLQNNTPQLRKIFISDKGKKFCKIDLEQAESRACGLIHWELFNDPTYLDACEAGDLHTAVAQMVWPELPWTGNPAEDKEIAERQFYRHFTYRDMSKRGGHASNYKVTPFTMSQHLKIELKVTTAFQERYFGRFTSFPRWHRWVAEQIQTKQYLDTPLGNRRYFFSRPSDDATLRQAIAHSPQSTVGQILNLGLWRVWRYMEEVELIFQDHDALTFQYDDDQEVEKRVVEKALKLIEVPIELNSRTMLIPGEAKIGWNRADKDDKRIPNWSNPNGLIKWKGEPDKRKRLTGLDRPL